MEAEADASMATVEGSSSAVLRWQKLSAGARGRLAVAVGALAHAAHGGVGAAETPVTAALVLATNDGGQELVHTIGHGLDANRRAGRGRVLRMVVR